MFPIFAIGTAISATAAVIKGVSWVIDQLSDDQDTTAEVGKRGPSTGGTPAPGSFDSALAARTAGQELPAGRQAQPVLAPSASLLPAIAPAATQALYDGRHAASAGALNAAAERLSAEDVQARINAGLAAYGRLSERQADRTAPHGF